MKNKKDISQTELNLSMDIDIEKDQSFKRTNTPKRRREIGALYNDDLSRDAVTRLVSDLEDETDSDISKSVSATYIGDQDEDQNYLDYINSVSKTPKGDKAKGLTPEEIAKLSSGSNNRKSFYNTEDRIHSDEVKEESTSKIYKRENTLLKTDSVPYARENDGIIGLLFSNIKIIVAISYVVVFAVFLFLILNINSLSSELVTVQDKFTESEKLAKNYTEIKIENEKLNESLEAALVENSALKEENQELLALVTPTEDPQQNNNGGGGATATNPPTVSAGGQKYTVLDKDTFWGIAVKFYNDGNKYQQIMDANNLKETQLKPGMTITIP